MTNTTNFCKKNCFYYLSTLSTNTCERYIPHSVKNFYCYNANHIPRFFKIYVVAFTTFQLPWLLEKYYGKNNDIIE